MKTIQSRLKKMDEENKMAWKQENFEELCFKDRLAYATNNFIGQIFNGGIGQFYENDYRYTLPTLTWAAESELNMPRLIEVIEQMEERFEQVESVYDLYLDEKCAELERELFDGLADELEGAVDEYLEGE